jgi:hypothetical protein
MMLRGNFCKGLAVLLVLGLFAAGCAKEKPPRSYVQSNVIDKGYFQGEWWHSSKVVQVNVPFEGMTYPGDATADYSGNGFSCSRIRWVIDENYLYAFRSYELVRGSNPDATNPVTGQTVSEYIGEPVAAYRIQSHFDIRRQYNPTTGENYNVIEENTVDRKWFERQYMRVDWSQNLLVSWMVNSAELYSDAGILDKEPVPMFVDQNSQWEDYFPAAWKPTFAFADPDYDAVHGTHLADDPATPEQEGDYMPGELYYMGITQQAIFTPGMVDDPYTGEPVPWCMSVYVDAPICTSNLVTMRSNFLKISPTHEYEPLYYPDKSRFDRFGAFRAERWTYDDITGDDPLDYHLGETDFLDYYANRFNIWADTYDEDGNLIPYDQRSIKHIVYHTSKEMPPWLWRPALEFMGEWNEVLMDIVRIRKNEGQALRDYMNIRDWYQPPDPALRDINCYLAAVTETGSYEFMEDPMAVGEDGLPLRTITSWDDFLDENRLTQTYDPDYSFQAPDGRTIRPGNECLLETRINSCSRPLYALPADVQAMLMAYMDEHGILDYADMTDDDRYAAGFECEERGDMRYKLVSYLADPGPPFLGVTSIQGDPVTGEIVWGDCNIAAWDLHRYRVRATDEIDLANGDITEIDYIVGEDVAGYYEKLGYTLPPPEPIVPRWLQGHDGITNGVSLAGINENMERVMKKAELLKGAAGKQNLLNYRRQLLQGTDIERKLLDNDEAMLAAGMITKPDEGTPRPLDAIIASISPFRHSVLDVISSDLDTFQKFSRNNVEMADFFQDFSVVAFAERHKDWPRTNVIFNLEQIMMKETLIHEFGHTLNLRHNMRGTADPWNYPEPYFDIVAQYPRPLMEDFDTNGDMMLDNAESDAYHAAYMEVEKQRELNQNGATAHLGSIDGWMTSSMMDYTGQWYNRIIPKGHYVDPYDKAAIHFSYGDLVEVYDNSAGLLAHCKDPASGRIADCITPDKVAKGQIGMVMWTYYAGGENCGIDDDCPYSWGGTQRWALEEGQGVAQWCNAGTCSNFYDDMHATYTGERPAYVVREYKYCTDERRTDIGMDDSQCNIFDEGASYRDIVQNMRDTYHRKYIFNNFRRFRGDYDFYPYYSAVVGRFFLEPVKIFQDMIYRYATDPAYRTDDGPFGFYDQYMASVDLLNFWTEIMAYPNVGAYKYLPYNNVWDQYNENPAKAVGGPPKFMRVDLGTGKYHYSRYQRGQNGVYRVEHFGTIYDKMWAQELLMVRGMAFPYSPDEYFYINFYDVFPEEITAMVRGMISDEPEVWKPRILSFDEETDNPILVMPTLYRGNCLPEEMIPDDAHPEIYSCRPDPMAQYPVAEHPPLQDYGSYYLMMYALIYGLSELPVYFDTQPQDMIHFYRVGSLFDADIPKCACDPDCACDCDLTAGTCDTDCACDPDCTADCTCDTNATCQNSVEGVDYVTFTSDMFHNTYLAFQVDDVQSGYEGYALKKGGSIAFDVLMKCKDYQQHLRDWEVCMAAGTTCGFESTSALSDAYWFEFYELQNYEGMINYAIELQQMFGIASWMGY